MPGASWRKRKCLEVVRKTGSVEAGSKQRNTCWQNHPDENWCLFLPTVRIKRTQRGTKWGDDTFWSVLFLIAVINGGSPCWETQLLWKYSGQELIISTSHLSELWMSGCSKHYSCTLVTQHVTSPVAQRKSTMDCKGDAAIYNLSTHAQRRRSAFYFRVDDKMWSSTAEYRSQVCVLQLCALLELCTVSVTCE